MLDLTAETVRRLSGIQVETSVVFNMATQFGGEELGLDDVVRTD